MYVNQDQCMHIFNNSGMFLFFIAAFPGGASLLSQTSITPEKQAVSSYATPLNLLGYRNALGDRYEKPGNERTVYTGSLREGVQAIATIVTAELPNKIRIQQSGAAARVIAFDGSRLSSRLVEVDEDLMETLFGDSPELFFYSLGRTAAWRLIGQNARLDDGRSPIYTGPREDIFQHIDRPTFRAAGITRQKHYYFDSKSLLLSRVRYRIRKAGGADVLIETRYSDWRKVGSQMLPARIERLEDGKARFTFEATEVRTSPATVDTAFATTGNPLGEAIQ